MAGTEKLLRILQELRIPRLSPFGEVADNSSAASKYVTGQDELDLGLQLRPGAQSDTDTSANRGASGSRCAPIFSQTRFENLFCIRRNSLRGVRIFPDQPRPGASDDSAGRRFAKS